MEYQPSLFSSIDGQPYEDFIFTNNISKDHVIFGTTEEVTDYMSFHFAHGYRGEFKVWDYEQFAQAWNPAEYETLPLKIPKGLEHKLQGERFK